VIPFPEGLAEEVAETHISGVFLGDGLAWKVRKPVNLGFLDFTALAERERLARRELELNAPHAPGLYRRVVPVMRAPDGTLALDGAGEVVEWALEMRRLPPGAFLDVAPLPDPRELGDAVAALHAAAPPRPGDGALDGILRQNRDSALAAGLPEGRVRAWHEAARAAHAALRPWLAERAAAGWLRRCHGDLHLGNLIEWQGRVMAFDAIEFDEDLRRIDVINDAAFTFMDLFAHDEPALAWRFVSAYLDGTGDHDGLRGLRPYAAYRALVRAHVALLGSGGVEAFGRYWRCLEALMAPPPAPGLWLMMGVSGSGKSTVAGLLRDALAEHGRPVVRVRSDVERKRLLGVAPTARPTLAQTAHWYGADQTRQTYDRLMTAAQSALAAGCSVVVDAASLRRTEREQMRTLAAMAGVRFHLWVCHAPQALMADRLVERERQGGDPSDAGRAVMERQLAWMEPVTADEKAGARELSNEGDLAALATQVQALLRQDLGT